MRNFIALLLAALAIPCAGRAQDYGAKHFGSLILNAPLAVASGGTGSTSPSLIAGPNVTITGAWPNQTIAATGGGGGTPGGSSGQVQVNNAGAFGGVTIGGDGALNTSTGALTISKSGGVAFGSAAFQAATAFDAAGAATTAQAASLQKASNLSDLASASTARTNLGLTALATTTPGAGVATALANAAGGAGGFALYSASLAASATTLPASFISSSLTSAAGGAFGTGAYAAAYSLPTASTSTLGGVKVDGTTITISGGVISSAAGAPDAGALTGATLAAGVTSSSLTTLAGGTVGTAAYVATGTTGATLCLLSSNCTFSGSNIHSGSELFTGAPGTFTANGQVELFGGTTVPTFNASFMNTISIGGYYASNAGPSLALGGGSIFMTSNGQGMAFQANSITLLGPTGGGIARTTWQGFFATQYNNYTTGKLVDTGSTPTVGNGTLTYSNGSAAFVISATGGTQTITLVLAAASTRWVCKATDETTLTIDVVATPTAGILTTGVTLSAVLRSTGALTNFTAGDVISGLCRAV